MSGQAAARVAWRGLPASVWALGFGSLFTDISSELIHSLLPVFMVTCLGASMLMVGVIEGVAEATAAVLKAFSGALSDRLGRRKLLMVLGYALSATTKPLFPLASSVGLVFTARFADRLGKGIRVAPRDALVAELAPPERRGAAYGLRQALDSVGAFAGPLLAVALMACFTGDIRTVLWAGVVPALIGVLILVVYVREPGTAPGEQKDGSRGARLSLSDIGQLPLRYWGVVALGGVFTLARFSEAFLVLRAQDVGLPAGQVPFVLVAMNVLYATAAFPAGAAADRVSRRTLLLFGLVLLIAADIVLAYAGSPLVVFGGAALWGTHMALTQGLLSKLVADTAPRHLLGTGFGVFNVVSGAMLLLASVIAGSLWSAAGPSATFLAGAVFAALAAAGIWIVEKRDGLSTGP